MYGSLKKAWVPETIVFVMWFGLKYPDLIEESSDIGQALKRLKSSSNDGGLSDPSAKDLFNEAINDMRSGRTVLPNIATHLGQTLS